MSSQLDHIIEARQVIESGFYANNLYRFAMIIRKMLISDSWPSASYILYHAAMDLYKDWDERPVPTEEAAYVEKQMKPLFISVLDGLNSNRPQSEMISSLDKLVTELFNLNP